jgi:hypothetical protein
VRHIIALFMMAALVAACGSKDDDSSATPTTESAGVGDDATPVGGDEAGGDEAGGDEAGGDEAGEGGDEATAEAPPTEQDFEEEAIAEISADNLKKMVDELEKELADDDD